MAHIEMYTTHVCPYCVAAKNLLKAKGLTWDEIFVDSDPSARERMLERSQGARTVPQIFINGQRVGGYDDLVAADRSGQLATLLADPA
ncbi:MAG TPA: glutaredoxin 3 [Rhodanobacteraceae bacterium]